jgi:photosystem II stability/assembly factor-like uncharacterized protein
VAWLTLAGLAVLVAGVVYLRPAVGAPGRSAPRAPATTTTPLPSGASATQVGMVFRDADHGMVIFLGGPFPPQRTGATYITADGGRTWTKLLTEPGYAVYESRDLLLSHTASSTRISRDGGRTWRALADPRQRSSDISVAAFDPVPVFADANNGWWLAPPASIWRTRDGGRTWAELPAPGIPQGGRLAQLTFTDLTHGFTTFLPDAYAGEHVVLATEDGGDSWHRILSLTAPIPGATVLQFALFSRGAGLVVAFNAVEGLTLTAEGNGFTVSPANAQIASHTFTLASNDRGRTWSPVWPGPTVAGSADFSLTTALPTVDGGRIVLLEGHRLWTSNDAGATWSARVATMPEGQYPISPAQAVPGAIFVQTSASAGPGLVPVRPVSAPRILLRSRDGGVHWEQVPLPPAPR